MKSHTRGKPRPSFYFSYYIMRFINLSHDEESLADLNKLSEKAESFNIRMAPCRFYLQHFFFPAGCGKRKICLKIIKLYDDQDFFVTQKYICYDLNGLFKISLRSVRIIYTIDFTVHHRYLLQSQKIHRIYSFYLNFIYLIIIN